MKVSECMFISMNSFNFLTSELVISSKPLRRTSNFQSFTTLNSAQSPFMSDPRVLVELSPSRNKERIVSDQELDGRFDCWVLELSLPLNLRVLDGLDETEFPQTVP